MVLVLTPQVSDAAHVHLQCTAHAHHVVGCWVC